MLYLRVYRHGIDAQFEPPMPPPRTQPAPPPRPPQRAKAERQGSGTSTGFYFFVTQNQNLISNEKFCLQKCVCCLLSCFIGRSGTTTPATVGEDTAAPEDRVFDPADRPPMGIQRQTNASGQAERVRW